MKQVYKSPAVVDYGSIADCTFATPANGGSVSPPEGNTDPCWAEPTGGPGTGKNWQVLQCDKFGEYSHS